MNKFQSIIQSKLGWLIIPLVVGFVNALIGIMINPVGVGNDNANNTIVGGGIGIFLAIAYGFCLAEALKKKEKMEDARDTGDKEAFQKIATRRLPWSFWIPILICIFYTLETMHQFHFESTYAIMSTHFKAASLYTIALLILHDIDDPIHGVVNISNIPEGWID
jgi:hypothetical protein